ncbi:phosphoglycerate mutase-like protein [Lactarius pseudohatsudake]|nr:phosphoglycerate mutase-like protein [Lactarius pseudohatsudake]
MSNSVMITFIRHAESTDNNRSIWHGWKDAPLSYTGTDQARALGQRLADTRFTAIYTSDLQRASDTAQAIYDHQKDPKPSFDSSELFREQNFGLAAGHPISIDTVYSGLNWEEHAARGVYLGWYSDDDRFPEGESIKDLAERARKGLEKFVLPHVWRAAEEGKTGIHIAVVSHGLCITELVSELLKKSAEEVRKPQANLLNTGWIRVAVDIEGAQEGRPIDVDKEPPVLTMDVTQIEGRKPNYDY